MRVVLISLPWSEYARPSGALGALTAYLRRELPQHEYIPMSRHLTVAATIGYELYNHLSTHCYDIGEILWMSVCYPERADAVRQRFVSWAEEKLAGGGPAAWVDGASDFGAVFDHIQGILDADLDELAALAAGADVVGMTTCFGQLFGNIALAQRIKQRSPAARIVLGGSTVSSRVGPSLVMEYPEIDFVVQGEGEKTFTALIESLATGGALPERGVVTRGGPPARLWEVEHLDQLPIPDFDEYAALAEEKGVIWVLPIEGSRGCWWDRTKRANNPKATCYFCNLNVQWSGYREKSVARVVEDVDQLTHRHQVTQVFFVDNIIRHHGIEELARGLAGIGRDLEIFYEMRANVTPHQILLLWEAGLNDTQFGIEGLSTSFLRRIGKGTSVIQNLQVMKTCFELNIRNTSNLIIGFPGSTIEEVEETRHNIESFAIAYEPSRNSPFFLGVDATLDTLHDEFGITGIRNGQTARVGLPDDLYQRLQLFDLDYDLVEQGVSWQPVLDAVRAWREHQREVVAPLLTYHDGGSFLRIIDRRGRHAEVITLEGWHRAVYLACMEIEGRDRLVARHASVGADVEAIVEELIAARLLFAEDGKLLALATATSPRVAARRIRADAEARRASASTRRGSSLRLEVIN